MGRSARAAEILNAPGIGPLARAVPLWSGVLVLVYHRIASGDGSGPDGGVTSASQEGLDAQLGFLTSNADLVGPDDLPGALDARGRHVLVTFDDGYRDNYELAFPLLRGHGVRAAFFLVSGFIDSPRLPWWDEFAWIAEQAPEATLPSGEWLAEPLPLADRAEAVVRLTGTYKSLPAARAEAFLDWCGEASGSGRADPSQARDLWMTWDMAREMQRAGMAFGGHTHNHPVLSRLDPAAQEREIALCRRRLQEELGHRMRLFSYPVGLPDSFDAHSREGLQAAGVEVAFSCYGGYQRRGRADPFDVRRANVSRHVGPERLNAMLVSPGLFARW